MRPRWGQGKRPEAVERRWWGFLLGSIPFAPLPAFAKVSDTFQNGNAVVLSGLACGGGALGGAAGALALAGPRAPPRLRPFPRQVGPKKQAAPGGRAGLLKR